MSNTSQALKVLKQSATEQNNELESFIKEIHKQSLEQLGKDLHSTTKKKLSSIENDINETMESLKEQNKWRYSLQNLIVISIPVLILGIVLGEIIFKAINPTNNQIKEQLELTIQENKDMSNYIAELQVWQVPETMRYTHTDKSKWVQSKKAQTLKDGTTYIQIGK